MEPSRTFSLLEEACLDLGLEPGQEEVGPSLVPARSDTEAVGVGLEVALVRRLSLLEV